MVSMAAEAGAVVVCFPEAYLPGLRGQDFEVLAWDRDIERKATEAVASFARKHSIAVIAGLERVAGTGRQIAACVIGPAGEIAGYQAKTQLDPSEDQFYVPGSGRRLFEAGGVKFGIAICHEGWRYPETVRWAAARGAKIVFHPQHTGYEHAAADPGAYYPRAMEMRARENTIWFASVNYALRNQESATSVMDPEGKVHATLAGEGVLVTNVDPERATGLLARRYAPDRY